MITREYLYNEYIIKNRKIVDIANECGLHSTTLNKKCRQYGITKNISVTYLGKKFGKLTPIECTGERKNGHKIFKCKCECGVTILTNASSLKSGATTSCGCKKHYIGRNNKHYKGYEEISGLFWTQLKNGAKSRNIEFSITISDMWDLFIKQNRMCALSGMPLRLEQSTRNKVLQTASLDRIDSTKGYTIDNVQWVHKILNIMKWSLTSEEFISICHLVSSTHKDTKKLSNFDVFRNVRKFKQIWKPSFCKVSSGAMFKIEGDTKLYQKIATKHKKFNANIIDDNMKISGTRYFDKNQKIEFISYEKIIG